MSEPQLNYLGSAGPPPQNDRGTSWLRKVPAAFIIVVVIPTLLAAFYFLVIASPLYVSEAKFIVRTAGTSAPSAVGIALQGVGLSSGQTNSFAVHDYIRSPDAVMELGKTIDVDAILAPAGADILSRYPGIGEKRTSEGLVSAMRRFVTVGYDSTTGISTLRVKAFRPTDAQRIATTLLVGGEGLVNRLNARSVADAAENASIARAAAERRLSEAQARLSEFRSREQIIDPETNANESGRIIATLSTTLIELRAERNRVQSEAPESPSLSSLNSRIAAYEREIDIERAKIAGNASSLAPKVGVFEALMFERELASRDLSATNNSYLAAEQDARRQQVYLEQIVEPSMPEEALEPRRWYSILTVLATCLLIYSLGWLIWAGVREHRQA